MGMYTALVFKAPINVKEYGEVIRAACSDGWPEGFLPDDAPSRVKFGCIPRGSSAYCEEEREFLLKANRWEEGLDGNLWTCSCELKNYEGEIEWFLEHVLRPMLTGTAKVYEAMYFVAVQKPPRYGSTAYEEKLQGPGYWARVDGWSFEEMEPMKEGEL